MYNMAQIEEAANTASSLHQKFLRNMEGVTEEDRETRYKKAFDSLKKEICVAMANYCYMNILSVYIPQGSDLYATALEITQKNLPAIMYALWKSGMEEAEKKVEMARTEFLEDFYFPLCSKSAAA